MKDLKTLLGNYDGLKNDLKFASISDEIWRLGSLEEIKNEVSHEAFTFHLAVNMIAKRESPKMASRPINWKVRIKL